MSLQNSRDSSESYESCDTYSSSDDGSYEPKKVLDAEECAALLEEVRQELHNLQFEDEAGSEEDEEDIILDTECVNDLIVRFYKWMDAWDLQFHRDAKSKDVERELRLMAGDFVIKKKSIVHE